MTDWPVAPHSRSQQIMQAARSSLSSRQEIEHSSSARLSSLGSSREALLHPTTSAASASNHLSTAEPRTQTDLKALQVAMAMESSQLRSLSDPHEEGGIWANNSSTSTSNPMLSMRQASPVTVLIRRLPLTTSEDSLRYMVIAWSEDLVDVELLPQDLALDPGSLSAILRFHTISSAVQVQNTLNGRSRKASDANLIVEIRSPSPTYGRPYNGEAAPANASSSASSADSSNHGSRQPSRFNGGFPSAAEQFSPTSHPILPTRDRPSLDAGAPFSPHYTGAFNGQSPFNPSFGEHQSSFAWPQQTGQPRVSGKSLINDDSGDDETNVLISDPVAYAQNGYPAHRRATEPQIPIDQMANMTLRANNNGAGAASSSLPPYMNSGVPSSGAMRSRGPPISGPPVAQHAGPRPPPSNPADLNPPCNTLYVGNLPIDTSEEELKALFSRQRGYKRLCFRTKHNGPMCFVEFEDISFATKILHELYGYMLSNSVRGGIRLSFSKNPLGQRSVPGTGQNSPGGMNSHNGASHGSVNGSFSSVSGPPPGLAAPPGLASRRDHYSLGGSASNGNGHGYHNMNGPAYNSNANGSSYTAANGPGYNTVNGNGWNNSVQNYNMNGKGHHTSSPFSNGGPSSRNGSRLGYHDGGALSNGSGNPNSPWNNTRSSGGMNGGSFVNPDATAINPHRRDLGK